MIILKDTKKILEGLLGTELTQEQCQVLESDTTVQKYLSVVMQDNKEFQQYIQNKYSGEFDRMDRTQETDKPIFSESDKLRLRMENRIRISRVRHPQQDTLMESFEKLNKQADSAIETIDTIRSKRGY